MEPEPHPNVSRRVPGMPATLAPVMVALLLALGLAAGSGTAGKLAGVPRSDRFLASLSDEAVRGAVADSPSVMPAAKRAPLSPHSTSLVISQIYGGGGNTGAPWQNDFIEVFNPTGVTVDLSGWSVQYASAAGSTWQVTTLAGSIPAGGYYLIAEAAGASCAGLPCGSPLPAPDASGVIAMGQAGGKVALVSDATPLSGTCPTGGAVVDFAGYGSANCFEGTGPALAIGNTSSIVRSSNGCIDTDDNAADFAVSSTITPRNSSSPFNYCVATATPTDTGTPTDTPTDTPTATDTPTETPTDTPTETPTDTPTPVGGVYGPLWSSVDGGGGMFSTGGDFAVGGTIGQPDAGSMAGGDFAVRGGFWHTAVAPPTPTATPTAAAVLVCHVTWQGRPAQPNPLQQLPITLTLKSATIEVNYPVQTTDSSGFFTVDVSTLPNDVYTLRTQGPDGVPGGNSTPGFLAVTGTVTLAGAAVTQAEMGLQRGGDASNDNLVDVVDFNTLKGSFGKTPLDPGYDPTADFTGDEVVDVLDFNTLKSNFGTAGAPPLRPGRSNP